MIKHIRKHHILFLFLLSLICAGTIFYIYSDQKEQKSFIRPYDQEKDFAPLLSMINDDLFWLAEVPADFSPELFLTLRAPYFDPSRKGQAIIDVMEADGASAGFVAYYKKSPTHGYVWIFAVDKNFRRRGFGEKLIKHALSQLKKQGAQYATLTTRLAKTPAMQLYYKVGFVEQKREEDRGIVTLIKRSL